MKRLKTIIGMWITLSVALLSGCVEEFEANISDAPIEGLVIEGDIISDSTVVFNLNKKLPLTFTGENEVFYDTYLDVNAELSILGRDGTGTWKRSVSGRNWHVEARGGISFGS